MLEKSEVNALGWKLNACASNGDLQGVLDLLSQGAQPAWKDESQRTAVICTIYGTTTNNLPITHANYEQATQSQPEHASILRQLLRHLLSDNIRDREIPTRIVFDEIVDQPQDGPWLRGITPLCLAAYLGKSELVRVMLEEGADVDSRDKNGATALMYAARDGRADVVEVLLSFNARVQLEDINGWSAERYGKSYPQVIELVKRFRGGWKGHGELFPSALKRELTSKYPDFLPAISRLIFQRLNTQPGSQGPSSTALTDCQAEKTAAGSGTSTPSPLSQTNLLSAIKHHDLRSMLQILQNCSVCNVYSCDPTTGVTPLQYTLRLRPLKHPESETIVRVLVALGANVNARNVKSGKTPLHYAVRDPYFIPDNSSFDDHRAVEDAARSIVRFLLACGADVNTTDLDGNLPLHYACRGRDVELTRILLSGGRAHAAVMNKKGKRPMDVCSNEEMVSVIRQYLQTPPIPHGKSREALQLQDTQEFGENAVSQAHDHTAPGSLPSSRPTREALQLQDTQDFGENAVSQAHDHTKPGSLPSSRPTTPFHENAKSSPSKLADSAYSSSDALKTLAEGLAELERLPPLRQSSSSEEVHSMNQKREPSAEETRSLLSEMTRKYEESRREGLEWKSKFEQSRLQEEQALRMVKRLAECMSTNSNPSGGRPVNDNSTPISKTFPEQEARELLQLDVCLASAKNILDALRAADEESNGAIRYTEGMLSNLQRQQQALLKEVLNAKEIFYDTLSSLNTFELRMLSQLSGSQDQQIRKRPMDAGENYSPRRQDEVLQKVGRQNFPKFDDSPERHDQEQKRLGQTAKVTFSSVPREEISESTADQATRAGQCEGETETALLSRLLYAAKQRIQQLKKSLVSLETEKRSLQQKYLEKEAEAEQLLGDKRQIEGKYDTMLKNYLRDAKNVRAIAQKMLADPPVPDADSQDLDLLKGDRLGLLPKLRNLYREMSRRRTEGASKQMPTADEAQAINAKFLHVIHTLPEPNMENFSEAAIEKLTVALMEATDLCQRYATSIMEWYANNQQESKVVLHELDNIIAVVGGDGADNRHGAELDSRTTKASAPNDIEMQWKHSPDHTVPTASTESPPGLKEGQDGPHTTRFEPSSSAERSAKEEAQPLSAATDDRDCRWSTDPLNHSQDSSEEANWTRSLMTDASGAEQDNDTKDESPESSLVDDQTTMTNGRSRATTADQDFSTGRGPLESETGRGLMGPDTSGASSISPAASSGASTPLRIFESTGRDSENQRLLQSTPEIEELMKSIQKAKKSLGSDGETKATGRKEYNDAVKRLINVMRSEDEGRANMALTGIPNLSKPVDPMVIPDVTRMLTVGSSSAGTPVPNVMSERTGSFGLDEDTQDALTRSLPDIITKKEVFPRPIAETLTLPSSSRRASPVTPRNGVGPLPTLVEDKDEEDDEPARRAARESRILTILGKRPGEKSKGGFFGRLMRLNRSTAEKEPSKKER